MLLQRFELLVSTSSPLPKRSVGSILSSVREFRQNIISLQQDHTSQSGINTAIPTGTGVDKGRAGKLMIQLDPNTRKTKYVVELFMPGIKNLRRIFHQRDMKGIRDAILALILKAAEAEYNKLLCFFTILKGLVDVINDNICSEIRIIENSENAIEENTPSRSPSMYANMRRMVSGSAAFSSTISGKSPAPSPAKMAMSAAASLVPMRSPSIKKAQENSISASMSASANSIPTASKNKLKVQYDKLLERYVMKSITAYCVYLHISNCHLCCSYSAMQIVSDIIDNVEISIWDAAIEKVAAAHAIAMSTD